MPLFQTKSKKKQPAVFAPEQNQNQTQSNTFQQPAQKGKKAKSLNMKAVKADPLGALAEIIEEFDGQLSEAVTQLSILHTIIEKLDRLIDDDKTMLHSNNPQLVASVKANISCIQNARKEHQAAMHEIVKSLLGAEKDFVSKRLQIDKALNADNPASDGDNITDEDWTAYEKQLHLDVKTKIVTALKNKELSESIPLPVDLRIDSLQEEGALLKESAKSSSSEIKRERREQQEKKEATVVSVKEQIRCFMDNSKTGDPGFLKQIHTLKKRKKYTDFLNHCHKLKEKIWDKDKGAQYLDPEFIVTHMKECVTILGASVGLIEDYNSRGGKDLLIKSQINYLAEKNKNAGIPEDAAKAAAENEAAASLDILKNTLEYFQKHIENVLTDYGLQFSFRSYDCPYIAEMSDKDLTILKQIRARKDEQELYQTLLNAEANLANPLQDKVPNDLPVDGDAINDEEAKLEKIEKQLGIAADPALSLRTIQQRMETPLQINEDANIKTGYFRLSQYVFSNYNNASYNIAKAKRMCEIVHVLGEKLKTDNNGQESLPLGSIQKEFNTFIENCTDENVMRNNRLTDPDYLWQRVRTQLKKIILSSANYKEKNYAAFLYDQFLQIGGGELSFQGKVNYVAEDSAFGDMRSIKTYTDKNGEESTGMFISAEDVPLFEHEPCLKDINQGAVGDCYFLSAIASIVVNQPDSIKRIIKDNLDGTVTVRFYNYVNGRHSPVYVKVSKSIPVSKYASGRIEDFYASGPLWIKMLEKAYAVVRAARKRIRNENDEAVGEPFWDERETHEIKYENISSGNENVALQHLTGKTVVQDRGLEKLTPVKVFDGRVDIENVSNNISTLAYLIYTENHKDNKKAMDYLADLTNNQFKTSIYEKEYSNYKHLNDLLEQMLILQEGEKTLQLMDSKTFKAAVQTALAKLSTFKDQNGRSISDRELKAAGIPKEAIKIFHKCWKAYEKNGTRFYDTLSKMVELFNSRYGTSPEQGEYTKKENQFFEKIRTNVQQKKSCTAGTKFFTNYNSKIKGTVGEKFQDGMFATHAYTIIGAETYSLNGVTRKWLVLHNPHGRDIPIYKMDESGNITRMSLTDNAPDADSYDYDTHGIFLMELRDAFTVINELSFSN